MTASYAISNLGCTLGGRQILHDISLEVVPGRLLALVGPNGAGKSTLMGVLSGDLAPTSGSVSFQGRPLGAWEPRALARQRAVLLQANEVAFAFTVRQVVEMGRSPWWGHEDSQLDSFVVDESLERTDTKYLAERAFATLSGGEKARVSVARVLAQRTGVVLLDEPTAALDLSHQEDVMTLAREIAHGGGTVVVVVHDLSLAAAYADDVALIEGGKLIAYGTPASVLTAERIEKTYGLPVSIHQPDGQLIVVPRRTTATFATTEEGSQS